MPITLAVLVAGLLGALTIGALSRRRVPADDPMDPSDVEHWLVDAVEHRPRLARFLARIEANVAGGLLVVAVFAIVLVAGISVGWIFDGLDSNDGFAGWDDAVATYGADHITDVSAEVLRAVTRLGGSLELAVIIAVVAVTERVIRRSWVPGLFLVVVFVGILVLNNVLKWIVMRDRPDIEQLVGSSGSSFPSGHSATAAAAWAALALVVGGHLGRRGRIAVSAAGAGIACLVAASRALLGVHWLTDVIAGLIVGWAWFFLAAVAFGGRLMRFGDPVAQVVEDTEAAQMPPARRSVS